MQINIITVSIKIGQYQLTNTISLHNINTIINNFLNKDKNSIIIVYYFKGIQFTKRGYEKLYNN